LPLFPEFYSGGNDRPAYPQGPTKIGRGGKNGTVVEFSEVDVQYEPRGPIKGQVYADFVVELSSANAHQEEADFRWVLSVDGSSNQQGSGTDVILEGPNGLLIEQALRFAFKANNNQAEYEALIVGMLLAKEMGAQSLLAIPGQGPSDGRVPRVCPGPE